MDLSGLNDRLEENVLHTVNNGINPVLKSRYNAIYKKSPPTVCVLWSVKPKRGPLSTTCNHDMTSYKGDFYRILFVRRLTLLKELPLRNKHFPA